jgi:probable addiction module antidote protein
MKKINTSVWDASENLETEGDMIAYLEAAFEEGGSSIIAAALGDIARAKGMAQIAKNQDWGVKVFIKPCPPVETLNFPPYLK